MILSVTVRDLMIVTEAVRDIMIVTGAVSDNDSEVALCDILIMPGADSE